MQDSLLTSSGPRGVNGSCVSELCSFLLHAAHDELCDGKMLLREKTNVRGACWRVMRLLPSVRTEQNASNSKGFLISLNYSEHDVNTLCDYLSKIRQNTNLLKSN